jgi:hypothetical protein
MLLGVSANRSIETGQAVRCDEVLALPGRRPRVAETCPR